MERLAAGVALALSGFSAMLTGAVAADYSPQPTLIATNPFLGSYVALGGSYDTASPRSFGMTSSFPAVGGLITDSSAMLRPRAGLASPQPVTT
jgi:hypothetical protein